LQWPCCSCTNCKNPHEYPGRENFTFEEDYVEKKLKEIQERENGGNKDQ